MENQKFERANTQSWLNKYLVTAVIIFSSLLTRVSPIAAQAPVVKNIVIEHGAFADGSGWKGVFTILENRGYHVTIVQNPLTSLNDDVEATNRILDQQNGPVGLWGHSSHAVAITQTDLHPRAVSLI